MVLWCKKIELQENENEEKDNLTFLTSSQWTLINRTNVTIMIKMTMTTKMLAMIIMMRMIIVVMMVIVMMLIFIIQ